MLRGEGNNLKIELRTSPLFPRVDVEKQANDDQHQAFHEDEEARNECSIIVVRVLIGHQRAKSQTSRQPDQLSFSIPRVRLHYDFGSSEINL